jgi:hypothetical protein
VRLSKPTPATAIAIAALFVALGGSAVAANRYIITSASQIKPSVLSGLVKEERLVISPATTVNPGQAIGVALANCAADEHVVTGGYAPAELAQGAYVVQDAPRGSKGWTVLVNGQHGTGVSTVRARALCAPGVIPVTAVSNPQK